jgi:hypothetical protein
MAGDYVIALYRPRPGLAEDLSTALAGHVVLLRELGFATDAPSVRVRSQRDGTWLEAFQWTEGGAVASAEHPDVQTARAELARCAVFVRLADLAEAERLFPTFSAPAAG